ncbi:MAG: hypothetical protein AAGF55_08915, partial [Pseudomonadota bacterium]
MANTPSGPNAGNSKSSKDNKAEKPAAADLQAADLGATKGADVQIAAAAPAAMASLTGFATVAADPIISPETQESEAVSGAPLAQTQAEPGASEVAQSVISSDQSEAADSPAKPSQTDPVSINDASGIDTVAPRGADMSADTQTPQDVANPIPASAGEAAPSQADPEETGGNGGGDVQPDMPFPDIPVGFEGSLAEDAAAGSVVTELPATDGNGAEVTYRLTDEAGTPLLSSPFEVSGNMIRLRAGAELDFETADSVQVYVTATTAGGTTAPLPITVEISDVAEAITLS